MGVTAIMAGIRQACEILNDVGIPVARKLMDLFQRKPGKQNTDPSVGELREAVQELQQTVAMLRQAQGRGPSPGDFRQLQAIVTALEREMSDLNRTQYTGSSGSLGYTDLREAFSGRPLWQ
eukprot:jgi/Tetstr1/434676/TSEL_002504.t1